MPLDTMLPDVVGEPPEASMAAAAAATPGKPPSPGGTGEVSFGAVSAGVLIPNPAVKSAAELGDCLIAWTPSIPFPSSKTMFRGLRCLIAAIAAAPVNCVWGVRLGSFETCVGSSGGRFWVAFGDIGDADEASAAAAVDAVVERGVDGVVLREDSRIVPLVVVGAEVYCDDAITINKPRRVSASLSHVNNIPNSRTGNL